MNDIDNETWLLEKGDEIIEKKSHQALSRAERAVYCLWVIDYSIRNAGDLEAVDDVYSEAPEELITLAGQISLEHTADLMSSYGRDGFEDEYYSKFDKIISELKAALL